MKNLLKRASKLADKERKVLSDITGVSAVTRVGGNLARNTVRTLQGKKQIPLYTGSNRTKDFVGDAVGLATFGGLVKGIARSGVSKPVKEYLRAVKNPNVHIPTSVPKSVSVADKAAKIKAFRKMLHSR